MTYQGALHIGAGIHVAAAIAVGADSLLTYDERLATSAEAVGLNVLAPVA